MTKALPLVSVVVPARPGQDDIPAVSSSRLLDYPLDRLEIVVVRGTQPAAQRNAAIQKAQGEFIYFLDDDARPEPGNLQRAVRNFGKDGVEIVGGPNLCPEDAPLLEQIFAVVLGSWLAMGPSRARYEVVGKLRETSEKELILCNLMARRESVVGSGGFDESLYPNEENALMDELQRRGGRLIYDPEFTAHRRPRPNLRAFGRMMFRYGRGRAEQFRLHPTFGSAPNFVPPMFCLFLATLPLWGPAGPIGLAAYAVALLAQTVFSAAGRAGWKAWLALPLIVMTHICYGLGFWRGFFTRVKPATAGEPQVISVETVRL